MPLFPSPIETHANTMARMRARAFRPVTAGISFVAPWEAKERIRPVIDRLSHLQNDCKQLDAEDPKQKDFLDTVEEFRKDHFEPLQKVIADGSYDCNGPQVFIDIDLSATIVEKLVEEFCAFGKPVTVVVKEKIPDYKPPPTFKETLKNVDWKKWALGGGAVAGLCWFLSRRTSEAILPLKSQEDAEKAAAIEKQKLKVGPPVKSEVWHVTAEDKSLLSMILDKMLPSRNPLGG
jgi:hypothetical protein